MLRNKRTGSHSLLLPRKPFPAQLPRGLSLSRSQEHGTQPLVGPASLSQSVFRVLSLAWGTQMGWGACKHRQNRGAPICSIVGYPGAAKNPVVWASPPSTTSELIIRWGAPCGLESALRHKAMLSLGPPGRRRERAPRFCLDKAELRGPCCCNQGFQCGKKFSLGFNLQCQPSSS